MARCSCRSTFPLGERWSKASQNYLGAKIKRQRHDRILLWWWLLNNIRLTRAAVVHIDRFENTLHLAWTGERESATGSSPPQTMCVWRGGRHVHAHLASSFFLPHFFSETTVGKGNGIVAMGMPQCAKSRVRSTDRGNGDSSDDDTNSGLAGVRTISF